MHRSLNPVLMLATSIVLLRTRHQYGLVCHRAVHADITDFQVHHPPQHWIPAANSAPPPSRPPSSQSSTHGYATALHFQRAIETSRQTQTLLHRPPTVAGGDGALDAPTHFRAQNPSKK